MRSNRHLQADNRFYPPNNAQQAQNAQFFKNRSSSSSNVTNQFNDRTRQSSAGSSNPKSSKSQAPSLHLQHPSMIRAPSQHVNNPQKDILPHNHPFNRVPIAGIEHHLSNINQNHGLLATRLTEYSQNILQTIDHSKAANSKFKVYFPQYCDRVKACTRQLIQVHTDQKTQIVENFYSVLRNRSLPTTEQALNHQARLRRTEIPKTERQLKDKQLQYYRGGGSKSTQQRLRHEMEALQNKLASMRIAINTVPTKTKATLLNNVLQDVVLPASADFAKNHSRYNRLLRNNLIEAQERTFQQTCTDSRFNHEFHLLISDMEKLEIIDKPD